MKKISLKSVAKGIVLSPVYIAGFCYGVGQHVVNKINSRQAVDEVEEKPTNCRTIYDNPETMAILSGKEDTL
jgi:hypothetical protein